MNLKFFISAFLLFSLVAQAQTDESKPNVLPNQFDTSMIALLPIDENANWFKSNQAFQLTRDDFTIIDSLLKACIETSNTNQKDTTHQPWNNYIHLDQYKRQYVAFLVNGERKLFINCLHSSFVDRVAINDNHQKSGFLGFDWRKQMVNVDGGGRNFFSVFINLTTKSYYDLWINAPI